MLRVPTELYFARKLGPVLNRLSVSASPALITGEAGTGKQSLAVHIHELSEAQTGRSGAFVRFYCGEADTEASAHRLFSHNGALAAARGGTLFLKHVHLLPLAVQAKLLIHWESSDSTDGCLQGARVLSSAIEPLERLVSRRQFLPDLYFRASAHKTNLTPLRENPDEVLVLFHSMVEHFGGSRPVLSRELERHLMDYPWPGNIRQLENIARDYAFNPNSERLTVELVRLNEMLYLGPNAPASELSLKEQVRRASKRLESDIILRALEQNFWNRRRTAGALRISYRTLMYKMKDCNLRAGAAGAGK